MAQMKDGCVSPARGPIAPDVESAASPTPTPPAERATMMARVGKPAPDFEATAFVRDHGFKPVRLSEYKGKWVILCFYPGDFTFV